MTKTGPPDNWGKRKLTRGLITRAEQAMEMGVPLETVAQANGIHRTTLWRWMTEGERRPRGHILREFYDRMRAAEARGEQRIFKQVLALCMAKQDPATMLKLMQARWPERYSPKAALEVSGHVHSEHNITLTQRQEFLALVGKVPEAQARFNDALRLMALTEQDRNP